MSQKNDKKRRIYGSNARRALFVQLLKAKADLEIEDSVVCERAYVGGTNGSVQHLFNLVQDRVIKNCKLRELAHDKETAWLPMDAFMTEMREAHQADFAEAKRRWQEANEQEDEETQAAAG
ncbi:TPA: hypothetical protein DDZ01_01935 [Candidatus Uhrbacteria bacterium]|nr:hypothetical protein [Candidatus Uhrbacteria bacterium]